MTMIMQVVAPFAHVYPLPLHALGVRNDLPFESFNVSPYARCEVTVVAQVLKVERTPVGLDLTFEILDGDCEPFRGLCDGNRIVVELNLTAGPHQAVVAENLLQLVFATGVSLRSLTEPDEIVNRPMLMSIAVPCQ